MLRKAFDLSPNENLWKVLSSSIAPPFLDERKERFGLPTGIATTTFIANFYLFELDHHLADDPSHFYMRYGDDLLFASESAIQVDLAFTKLQNQLSDLGLKTDPKKTQKIFFNGAGRAAPTPYFIGQEHVLLLGYRLHFNNKISLPRQKMRKLLNEYDQKIRRSYRLLKEIPLSAKGEILCEQSNKSFSPDSPFGLKGLKYLKGVSNSYLKQFRYQIALRISSLLTGRSGVKTFRKIPIKKLIQNWGLSWKK